MTFIESNGARDLDLVNRPLGFCIINSISSSKFISKHTPGTCPIVAGMYRNPRLVAIICRANLDI